ncbi:hypothetical protein ACRS7F_13385 [Brucella anthropi]|uniref:hypothetical protein n=1 Tax=Brucella anthropi TaxID=529 RepID=UPI003EDEC2EB
MPSKELKDALSDIIWDACAQDEKPISDSVDEIIATVADHLDQKAEAARKHAKAFHDKRKSGKYGLKKQARFYEEGKHYNRLAIGYAKSSRAIRALGEKAE